MMLPSFPVPVEGETVRSVVARFLGKTAGHATRKLELLGLRRTASGSVVPLNLRRLASVVPVGHPWHEKPQDILLKHTAAKTHLFFASAEQHRTIVEQLSDAKSPYVSVLLALSRRPHMASPPLTRFCPDCIDEDIKLRGFPVGYTEHELRMVAVCSRHHRPLLKSCARCFASRKAAGAWKLAGFCNCASPVHVSALEDWPGMADSSPDLEWLATQVRLMQSQDLPTDGNRLDELKQALMDCGYRARGGLDTTGVLDALEAKFGHSFLELLQVPTKRRSRSSVLWPSRVFCNDGSIPDALRCLLLTALVPGGGLALPTARPRVNSVELVTPKGYSSRQANESNGVTPIHMEKALAKYPGKITAAALAVGMAPSKFVSQLLKGGFQVPLPIHVSKRIGEPRLRSVEQALKSGVKKIDIQRQMGISEWTLSLIELSKPHLREEHRAATIERQRTDHRQVIDNYLKCHQHASRAEIRRDCSSAVDWLEAFDRPWLECRWPARKVAATKPRKAIVDWASRDELFASGIAQLAMTFKAEAERPTRVTKSRLLAAVGALAAMDGCGGRLSKTLQAAVTHSESVEDYQRRRLRWALQEHQRLGIPVSTNVTRRIAAFSPQILMKHGEYIVQLARELAVPIDARCSIGTHSG